MTPPPLAQLMFFDKRFEQVTDSVTQTIQNGGVIEPWKLNRLYRL